MELDLVLRNGLLIDGDQSFEAEIGIADGRIAVIGFDLPARRELDALGCYVIPGGVDPHVHFDLVLSSGTSADSFSAGSRGAACGGTTTIIDFTAPLEGQPLFNSIVARRRQADGQIYTDYGLHMTVPTWHGEHLERLSEVERIVHAGIPTFKLYQAYEGMALDDVALHRVMQRVGEAGGRVVLHSETGPLIEQLRSQALADGHTAPIWHERTRPALLEASAVERALAIGALTGCPLYIFHVGAAEVVERIRDARERGVAVTAESCPHYLILSAEKDLGGEEGALFICAPPLRSIDDQERLWTALDRGEIDVISTDHCPWMRDEKVDRPFTEVPGGLPGVETRLALLHHFGVRSGRITLERWVELCSRGPARLMGLTSKGRLQPGKDADLVLFDPNHAHTLEAAALQGAADWSPYAETVVQGWPRTVLLRGQPLVVDGEFVARPGQGRFVERKI